MWWDTSLIEATVTRQFVCSHLLPEEIERLDRALGFGGGLTDGTYWEWIQDKAKKIFLILVDLGVPDQIFGVIDDAWDDTDLPIALDQVERLALTATRDDRVDRRFYYRQFQYLLHYVEKGQHAVYHDVEVVPIEVVDRRPGAGLNASHSVDKVQLPNRPGEIFSRRRIPVGTGNGVLPYEEFLYEVNSTKNVQNDHLKSYFASYTHQGFGYVLFTPASDYSLKSILASLPAPLKALPKNNRRLRVMNWVHCLADTLCYLHNRGRSHGNIRPSTILFNTENHVFFTDISRLRSEALANSSDKAAFDKESYDYAAPEQWFRPTACSSAPHRKSILYSPVPASPENGSFSINRNTDMPSPASILSTPNPHLNPQAADIFSLGCVILELLSMQMKRQTRSFASHRAAKHKTPGRGGAVLDSSFHKNLSQVESWMAGLAKDASKKDDQVFRGIAPMLKVVARMLSAAPHDRPTAQEVEQRIYNILKECCQIEEPHCVHQYGWDFGFGNLRIGQESEKLTIATKRHSGGTLKSLEYRRTNSSGSGSTAYRRD
ncbi:protein kinase [Pseudomassariella vexata]|uniref:Protein kinase n=1 Tax=Pseudomassariella vexata TaxID=1141098 RepID=A0A1Y2D7D1_9PEZI|nr:protein kinase [Pseudomassariella vexata]ORY55074.1 protein kinase [Pseudomassariella vexata]